MTTLLELDLIGDCPVLTKDTNYSIFYQEYKVKYNILCTDKLNNRI